MNWGRLSLIIAALGAPSLYAWLRLPDAGPTSFPLHVGLQFSLVVLVIVLIAYGANWLVDSACRIAHSLGISHLVIGLTVVAFGTSAPEAAASLVAGLEGSGDLAVANVVGSNVFNLCFILGGVALLLPKGLPVDRLLVFRDGSMLLLGTSLLFLFVGALPGADVPASANTFWPQLLNRRMERAEGLLLVGLLVSYLVLLYRSRVAQGALRDSEFVDEVESFGAFSPRDVPMFMLGLAVVVIGCQVLVGEAHGVGHATSGYGALWFASVWNVPQYVVGITIVAAGTSAPEFIVSLVAAVRGAHGLSAGNLIGSDIFNFYGVMGMAGALLQPPLAQPVMVSPSLVLGVFMPTVVAIAVIVFMRTGMRIGRGEGAALVLLGIARWVNDLSFG